MPSRHRTAATIAAIALFPLLALPAPAAQTKAKTRPKATATPAAREKIFDPDVLGPKALEAGAQVAFKSGRRLFVAFGTNDCDPCRVFNDVLHEPKFLEEFLKQFVPVLIDVTPGSKNAELLVSYGIDTSKGLPACAYFSPDAIPQEITRSGELAEAARKGNDAVLEFLLKRFQKSP